jgi:photosystem II stability/assembly factor-like uncharacterized protein
MHQNLSIRAIDVIDENKICFAANNGVFGYSDDAGKTWYLDTISIENYTPQFRSIEALNDSTILILSVDSPAYLLKTTNKGRDWKIVYENHEKDIFFDALKAKNANEIWAIGDPINNYPFLIYSMNAGDSWQKYNVKNLPKVEKNEAFFAASNSNISFIDNNLFLVSGGSTSNLIQVNTSSKTFIVKKLPFIISGSMTGAYSIDMFNQKNFAISGGNYDKNDKEFVPFYYTTDGGKIFKTLDIQENFFGSCVRYLNKNELYVTGHRGTFFINLKKNKIVELKDKDGNKLNFHTLRISDNKKKIILAGANGRIASIDLK